MMHHLKRIVSILIAGVMLVALSTCGSSEMCESYIYMLTMDYTNNYSCEKEYYYADCSSDYAFCSDKVTEHYTHGFGIIFFACDDCYKEIQGMNS